MACKVSTDFIHLIVDDEETLGESVTEIKSYCDNDGLLAVDCEGVNLSRMGELTILTIATKEKVYIYDVLKLGKVIFDKGIREFLEDESLTKLVFDCREDSDILWHRFNVKLSGVLDMQLLEVIHRWNSKPKAEAVQAARYRRRSQLVDEVEDIYGYRHCIELYIKDEKIIKLKKEGTDQLKKDTEIWKRRPLADQLIDYCCVDTHGLFLLYEKLKESDDELPRLQIASRRYADIWRSLPSRSMNQFEHNAYLPLDIIPEKGTFSFPFATTSCTTCHRKFPLDEFSKNQMRNWVQKCRVCKKVKLRMDVQKNREDNWERDADRRDFYYDDSDSDDYYGHYGFSVFSGYDSDDHVYYESDDYVYYDSD